MKKLILLSLLFVFACSIIKENKPPKWINTINNSDDYISIVGISGSNNESILLALMDIATYLEVQVKSDQNENKILGMGQILNSLENSEIIKVRPIVNFV